MKIAVFILLYFIYGVFLFFVHDPFELIIVGLPVVFVFLFLPRDIKRGLVITAVFGIFILVANLFSPSGDIIFKKGPLIIGALSLERGIERAIRLILLVMGAKILLWRFPPGDVLKTIERLFRKRKAIKDFVETALLTLKALPGVKRELLKLYSEKCLDGSLFNRLKGAGLVIVAVFVKAIHTPEEFF